MTGICVIILQNVHFKIKTPRPPPWISRPTVWKPLILSVKLLHLTSMCRALGRAGVGLPPSYTQMNTRGRVRRILGPLGLRSQVATSLNSRQFCLGVFTRGGVSGRQNHSSILSLYLFYGIHTYIQIYIR